MADAPGPKEIPYWVAIHLMAKDYGIAPWEVEENCTPAWFKQWSEYKAAESQEAKRQEEAAKRRK